MIKRLFLFSLAAIAGIAQDYKLESITTAAPGLPAAFTMAIQTEGYRVTGPKGPWC
jgi:hypothetical protein